MGEQWWDGWIGALLAAAVTVGATVWWDARVRRRERLEDAVVRLYEAATELGIETERVRHGLGSREDLGAANVAMGNALLLVKGLALRRVLLFPAKVAAPARSGLAMTVEWLADRWNGTSSRTRRDKTECADEVVEICQAASVACLIWLSKPMAFWPSRERGAEYVEMARKSNNRGRPAPS